MKRKPLCLLTALLVAAISAVTVSAADTYPVGDLDFNGSVSAADLTALARQVAKLDPLPEGYTAMGVPSWDCEHYASDWFTVKEPDCTQDGFRHTLCLICGKELEREILPATGHTEVVDEAVAPTCTETGLTEGVHCSACDEVLTAQEVLPAIGHTEVADAFVFPDCTQTGLTPGSHCGVCGQVIVAQRIIAALGHVPGEWEVTLEPTATTPGSQHKVCTVCGEETEVEEIAPLAPQGLAYTYDATTMTATVTGIGTCTDTDIVIPSTVEGYAVTGIAASAFSGNTSVTSIVIPDSVTGIGDYAFRDCTSLTSIELPDSVTSIGGGAFYNCTDLMSIELPNSVTSIDWYAFYGCSSLTSIVIPDSITSIRSETFRYCSSLTSIELPDSVTSIGSWAFRECSSLTSITYDGTVAQWNAIAKGNNWNSSTGNYTVTCTDGTVSK